MNIRREDVLQKFLYKALKQRSFALKCSAVSLKMLYTLSLLLVHRKEQRSFSLLTRGVSDCGDMFPIRTL